VDFGKQRGLSAKSTKTRPQVDFKETQGLLCQIPRNIDLMNYFPTVKAWTGSTRGEPAGRAGSTVDQRRRGPRVSERGGALTGVRPPGAPVHQISPAGTQKRERSTGSSARASPELGRWRGDRATAVVRRGHGNSVRRVSSAGEEKRRAR
jgi:hypothetical protein